MKELEFFKRQFLLTIHENFDLPWERKKILNYNLFYHPDLEFENVANKKLDLYLLGFIFDYENPKYSNKQILDTLSNISSFDNFLEHLYNYSGHYVIIYKSDKHFILINDAVAQHEIYYDKIFSSFGTQPKLLSKVISLLPHTSLEAAEFYSSPYFFNEKIFIGETTHVENILHLLPNHYIDLNSKKIKRFFPKYPIKPISIYEASVEARKMLKGYLKAASFRYNLAIGVSAGYDSRVLFHAGRDLNCRYYVTKLSHMSNKHYDLVIPKKLSNILKKELLVIDEGNELNKNMRYVYENSVDFPRIQKIQKELSNHIIINGNLSEIARNDYFYYKRISSEELAILSRFAANELGRKEYEKWLTNSSGLISKMGYNVLDMFFWEERQGHWTAKGKTEMSALGVVVYSPFCSHKLLTTLLSTPRKYRDYHNNRLYNLMIREFSPEAPRIPINPFLKNRIKKLLLLLRLLYVYKGIKLRKKVMRTFGAKPQNYFKT